MHDCLKDFSLGQTGRKQGHTCPRSHLIDIPDGLRLITKFISSLSWELQLLRQKWNFMYGETKAEKEAAKLPAHSVHVHLQSIDGVKRRDKKNVLVFTTKGHIGSPSFIYGNMLYFISG